MSRTIGSAGSIGIVLVGWAIGIILSFAFWAGLIWVAVFMAKEYLL